MQKHLVWMKRRGSKAWTGLMPRQDFRNGCHTTTERQKQRIGGRSVQRREGKKKSMSRRGGVREESVSEASASQTRRPVGEPNDGPESQKDQQPLISPGMDPYVAFQIGLARGRALAAQEQGLASARSERTAESKPETAQDPAPHLHRDTDQSLSGSTSRASSKQAKPGHGKSRRSSTDQPAARKPRSPKKAQSVPDLDPRLKFHMAMNLMGEKTAREYLVWVFLDEQTGQLPPGSEELINLILEQTLVLKRSEQAEPQAV